MRIVLSVVMLVLAACASKAFVDGDQAPSAIRKQFPIVHSSAECKSQHGIWRAGNDAKIFHEGGYCQFKASDGGRTCTSSDDCQGYCELSFDDPQDQRQGRCSSFMPPRWDRCVPGYFEKGKVSGRGECFGDDSEVQ